MTIKATNDDGTARTYMDGYSDGKEWALAQIEADAKRMRWLLQGNGYFMEEESLCGNSATSSLSEQDYARKCIDEAMQEGRRYD